MTCHRFGQGRLDALVFPQDSTRDVAATGRGRAKVVTGHRTPKEVTLPSTSYRQTRPGARGDVAREQARTGGQLTDT